MTESNNGYLILITPSLLNSFQYFINYDEDEQRAKYSENFEPKSNEAIREEFLATLGRKQFEPNEAMQKGIDFEEMVRGDKMTLTDWQDPIQTMQEIVKDGIWQATVKKSLIIGKREYLLYGRCDVIKEDTIFDIKFSSNYEVGKFLNSSQHRIYLYCSDLPKFSYLISDGSNYWREDYFNHKKIESEIRYMIKEFTAYLKNDLEASEIFYQNWSSK